MVNNRPRRMKKARSQRGVRIRTLGTRNLPFETVIGRTFVATSGNSNFTVNYGTLLADLGSSRLVSMMAVQIRFAPLLIVGVTANFDIQAQLRYQDPVTQQFVPVTPFRPLNTTSGTIFSATMPVAIRQYFFQTSSTQGVINFAFVNTSGASISLPTTITGNFLITPDQLT